MNSSIDLIDFIVYMFTNPKVICAMLGLTVIIFIILKLLRKSEKKG